MPDTLPAVGNYLYQVVAESDDNAAPPIILKQQWVSYSQLRPVLPGAVRVGSAFLDLPLGRYPRGAYLTWVIINPTTGNMLRTLSLVNEPREAAKGRLYAQPWLDAGLRQVEAAVTCRPAHGSAYTDHLRLPLAAPTY